MLQMSNNLFIFMLKLKNNFDVKLPNKNKSFELLHMRLLSFKMSTFPEANIRLIYYEQQRQYCKILLAIKHVFKKSLKNSFML